MNKTRIQRLRGFTLVELMISLALGAFLAIGLIAVFLNTKQSYRLQEASSRRLENGRYALSMLQKDIRASAYRGCLRSIDPDTTNDITVNSLATTTFLYNFGSINGVFSGKAIDGFEATAANTWVPALDATLGTVVSGTDAISLRVPIDNPGAFVATSMPATSAYADVNVTTSVTPAFAAGDVVMISNCSRAEVFYVTGTNTTGAPAGTINLVHSSGGVPGNLVKASCTAPAPNTSSCLYGPYNQGAQVSRIATISYFIRNSANNTGPALWQRVGNNAAVELAEGIENMQIQYGIDTDEDGDPDTWLTANNVTAANWNFLLAIRIAVLVANTDTAQARAAMIDNTTVYNLLGTNYGPFPDGRLRRVYTSTITLRNRAR